jgi:hypothetical protein
LGRTRRGGKAGLGEDEARRGGGRPDWWPGCLANGGAGMAGSEQRRHGDVREAACSDRQLTPPPPARCGHSRAPREQGKKGTSRQACYINGGRRSLEQGKKRTGRQVHYSSGGQPPPEQGRRGPVGMQEKGLAAERARQAGCRVGGWGVSSAATSWGRRYRCFFTPFFRGI